jgi:hypothetical protein
VGEDNKTIIHYTVAARVICVFSEPLAPISISNSSNSITISGAHNTPVRTNPLLRPSLLPPAGAPRASQSNGAASFSFA